MKSSRVLVAACAGLVCITASAATFTFDGHSGVDSNWSNADNWVGGLMAPNMNPWEVDAADVTLGGSATHLNVDADWGGKSLKVGTGAVYTITGSMVTVNGNIEVLETSKLYVNNTVKSAWGILGLGGNQLFNAHTTLGGIGTIDASINLATRGWPNFSDSSIIAPGDPAINNGIGTLTITKNVQVAPVGAGFHFAFGAAENSKLVIGGTFNLPAGTAFTITSADLPQPGVYDLITYTGAAIDPTVLQAEQLNLPASWTGNVLANLVSTSGKVSLDVSAVPEPVSVSVLALGGAALLARRRARAA